MRTDLREAQARLLAIDAEIGRIRRAMSECDAQAASLRAAFSDALEKRAELTREYGLEVQAYAS